jgi:predicted O-methyltransferase YrrM
MTSNKADKVLREIEGMSRRVFLPIIGPRKGQVLVDVIRKIKPKSVLEVGTLVGYSAILMGKELEPDAHLVTIEVHADEAKAAEENIKRAGIPPTVDVLVGDALEVIPKLRRKFDLVFVDAEKTEYLQYLKLVEDKLHKGSVVVADNAGVFARQMEDYLSYVRESGKYRSRYLSFGEDGVEVSEKL